MKGWKEHEGGPECALMAEDDVAEDKRGREKVESNETKRGAADVIAWRDEVSRENETATRYSRTRSEEFFETRCKAARVRWGKGNLWIWEVNGTGTRVLGCEESCEQDRPRMHTGADVQWRSQNARANLTSDLPLATLLLI
eukprot:763159-Hanusia_phi.AAC.7